MEMTWRDQGHGYPIAQGLLKLENSGMGYPKDYRMRSIRV